MATLYVDPAAGGANDGSSWTDAWTSVQSAIDYGSLAAGDIVYMRGTETPSAQTDFDGANGDYASGRIRFVGCNSGGTVDGTRFVLDYGNQNIHGCVVNNMDYISIEHVEIISSYATNANIGIYFLGSGSSHCVVQNVLVHGWSGDGINALYAYYLHLQRCKVHDCGGSGYSVPAYPSMFSGCVAMDNGDSGFNGNTNGMTYADCLAVRNGSRGFSLTGNVAADGPSVLQNCIAHANSGDGVYVSGSAISAHLLACRLTGNGGYGLNSATIAGRVPLRGCYFQGNTSGAINGNYQELNPDGAGSWNELAGSDTDYGYVDSANDDLNIASGATLRSKVLAHI